MSSAGFDFDFFGCDGVFDCLNYSLSLRPDAGCGAEFAAAAGALPQVNRHFDFACFGFGSGGAAGI